MRFGMHLRELWRLRAGVAASALVGLFVALWSVVDIGLFPPRVQPRSLEMGTAFTEVIVDTPHSVILDLRQGADDILSLKNRAVLVGNVMASPHVRSYIARRAGVPVESLQIVTPRTPEQPWARTATGTNARPRDLVKSTDQYRLAIQSDPTVPILDIYAQAPTAKASEELANAAVAGLSDYLRVLAASEQTPDEMRVRLRQLGAARGEVLNHGVQMQVAVVVFCLVFALSAVATVVIARVRRGWQLAAVAGQ